MSESRGFKFLTLLAMLYITFDLVSYLFVYRLITIHSFTMSVASFAYTTTYIIIDIVTEVYGYKESRRIIWFALASELIFALLIVALFSISNDSLGSQQMILGVGNVLRIFIASLITTPAGDLINSYAISKWKILTQGRYFWLRSVGSTMIGAAVYCAMTMTILFWGVVSLKHLLEITIGAYTFKILYAAVLALPASLLVSYLKSAERYDPFDVATNFNPFKI